MIPFLHPRTRDKAGSGCRISLSMHWGEDIVPFERATSGSRLAWQRTKANLDVLRVKQATTRFPLERRRGSTVPPAPPSCMFTPTVE
jgi:hypothetical protein